MITIYQCETCTYQNSDKTKVGEHERSHRPCEHNSTVHKLIHASGTILIRVQCLDCTKRRDVRINNASQQALKVMYEAMGGEAL